MADRGRAVLLLRMVPYRRMVYGWRGEMTEIYYCPIDCPHLIESKRGPFCALGYENKYIRVPKPIREMDFLPDPTYWRPEKCVEDERAEKETWD